jgi:hypothetical protein
VTGIDVSEAALKEARENLAKSDCGARIALRHQDVLMLDDVELYDLVKHSPSFIPEQLTRESISLLRRSLRPGGWLLLPFAPATDATSKALSASRRRLPAAIRGPTTSWRNCSATRVSRGSVCSLHGEHRSPPEGDRFGSRVTRVRSLEVDLLERRITARLCAAFGHYRTAGSVRVG